MVLLAETNRSLECFLVGLLDSGITTTSGIVRCFLGGRGRRRGCSKTFRFSHVSHSVTYVMGNDHM